MDRLTETIGLVREIAKALTYVRDSVLKPSTEPNEWQDGLREIEKRATELMEMPDDVVR